MHIRSFDKYTVIKRFSLRKKMYDIMETIYIQEKDPIHEEPQKVFSEEKEYLTDISLEVYESLCNGFIVKNGNDISDAPDRKTKCTNRETAQKDH